MLSKLHGNKKLQLAMGLFTGIIFGFLLQKGGVTRFDVIIGQLLLKDWTVVKIMMSAIIVGALGVHILRGMGLAKLNPKPGSWGINVAGGLIFGAGFAILGYCPGTISGAIGQGSLDAILGGLAGIILGSGIFAHMYPAVKPKILDKGTFSQKTLPEMLNVNPWVVVIPVVAVLVFILWLIEHLGG